jgi:hypothetical protein
MAKKTRSRTPKRPRRASSSSTKAGAAVKCSPDQASRRFARDLVIRGEARAPGKDGTLARDATHAIVPGRDGAPEVRRARFKMY